MLDDAQGCVCRGSDLHANEFHFSNSMLGVVIDGELARALGAHRGITQVEFYSTSQLVGRTAVEPLRMVGVTRSLA